MSDDVILKLNQYQARNLSALLRIISCGARILPPYDLNDSTIIFPNNGDWLGEIRWMLEPETNDDLSNFGKLPDWAAQKDNFLPIKKNV